MSKFSICLKDLIKKTPKLELLVACETENTARCSRIAAYPYNCVYKQQFTQVMYLLTFYASWEYCLFTVKQPFFLPFHNTWQE